MGGGKIEHIPGTRGANLNPASFCGQVRGEMTRMQEPDKLENPQNYEDQKTKLGTDKKLQEDLEQIGRMVTLEQIRREFDPAAINATIDAKKGFLLKRFRIWARWRKYG
jgi:hypothetical protein